MPALDRRIIVRRSVTTRNQYGESVETVTDFPVWASREDASQADKETAGAVLTLAARVYVVRYRKEIADALTSELSITDGALVLDALNITEATRLGERRKFLRIEAVGEVT